MSDLDPLRDYAMLDGEQLESLWIEIDRLREENAMLRTGDTCARMCEGTAYRIEARRLKAENATLRELVREALRGFLHGHDTNFIERAEKALGS